MKKILSLLILVLLLDSCGGSKNVSATKPLYEVLLVKDDGGANIRFFEILSEAREIKMLQNDDELKGKISTSDLNESNFVILNMGEKETLGYTIDVQKVVETDGKIILTVADHVPKTAATPDKDVYYYPHTIVKINSKKEIVIE
jgi:hypothetical protein